MDKNEFFTKRIRELANISFQRDIVTFSDFLNLNERNIVNSLDFRSSGVIVESFGGYDNAERQMGGNNYFNGVLYSIHHGNTGTNGAFIGKYVGGSRKFWGGPGGDICGSSCLQSPLL